MLIFYEWLPGHWKLSWGPPLCFNIDLITHICCCDIRISTKWRKELDPTHVQSKFIESNSQQCEISDKTYFHFQYEFLQIFLQRNFLLILKCQPSLLLALRRRQHMCDITFLKFKGILILRHILSWGIWTYVYIVILIYVPTYSFKSL